MTDEQRVEGGVTRLSFLKASAGAAAGAAAIGVPAVAEMSGDKSKHPVEPATGAPREPVVAYIRDEIRGQVTVMSGTGEATYEHPGLVKELLKVAPRGSASVGGELDVLAP